MAPGDPFGATEIDDTLAATGASGARSQPLRDQPVAIGRFTVLRPLGAGGMGVVYAAFDEQLDRKVAVKLLREGGGEDSSAGHARLRREAQAMARLAHPNVVAVYEVGDFEGQIFVAMELVSGPSLRAWLAAGRRPWREVLGVFLQAGRGLAAAHAAGLVHRDFKPENAIVGDDGRVRVLDFGLARAQELAREADATLPEGQVRSGALAPALTLAGALVGTPAYIAPELYARAPADARADQFAFCVALWEGLHGERPFQGESLHALMLAICEAEPRPPPRERRVPAWLHAALLRGLDRDPARRFPSMDALLAALDRDPERRRVRRVGAAVLAGLVVLVGLGARNLRAARAELCSGGAAQIAGVWGQEQKDRLQETFAATGLPYAADTAARTGAALDLYAAGWAHAHRDACEASAVRREQSQEQLDRRMACLEDRRRALVALRDVLLAGGDAVVSSALEAAHRLPAIAACSDPVYTGARVEPPGDPSTAQAVARVSAELATASALTVAHEPGQALARIDALAPAVHATGHRPLRARFLALRADALWHLGRYEESRHAYEAAHFVARAVGDDARVFSTAVKLIELIGETLVRPSEAALWDRIAEAELERREDPEGRLALLAARANVLHRQRRYEQGLEVVSAADRLAARVPGYDRGVLEMQLGEMAMGLSRFDQAAEHFQRGLELYRATYGPEHPKLAGVHMHFGELFSHTGDAEAALAAFRRAYALRLRAYGPEHVDLAEALQRLGSVLHELGRSAEAIDHLRRALALRERGLGPEHPDLGKIYNSLGIAFHRRGDLDAAQTHFERALALLRRSGEVGPAELAALLNNLAVVLKNRGELEQAALRYREAMTLLARHRGADHPQVGMVLINLGVLDARRGDHEAALARYEQALALLTSKLGADHPALGGLHGNIAESQLALGRTAAARQHSERAIALNLRGDSHPERLAEARFLLARALVASRDATGRALAEARLAREGFADQPARAAEVDRFLARHGGRRRL